MQDQNKILPVVGHVHGLHETLRLCTATANVALTLMKYNTGGRVSAYMPADKHVTTMTTRDNRIRIYK